MGTQGTGRKRSTKKERLTAEDDALNLIAREAEARLTAKRAARAEAREIRMKELERQQKEVEDRDYLEKGSRAASALTATTLTSLGGTSSRRGSGETAITVDAETSLREIKEIHELKDQIQDVESKYTQNLKEAKDTLAEVEEKYRKAMVSNAQLDNEKNNLMYQVDTLKDSLMELEELLSESRRGYEEKVKEYEREKHAHSVLQFQFSEMKETLKQSEELLNKHGIVLGPDLNINGDVDKTQVDDSPGEDPASPSAQDLQTSPTEGNSMLGNTKETQLRSSAEEEVDPEQNQEMFEEAEKNPVGSDTKCNVAPVSTMETLPKGQPTEEDSAKETDFSKNQNDCSVTETPEGEKFTQDVKKESVRNESIPAQQEPENTEEAENDNEEKMSSKSQPQGATASGKKKKKKRRGKKKGGTNEDNIQQQDGSQKEKGKAEKDIQLATKDNGTINARFCCWPVTETLKELKVHQVKNKQDKQKTKAVDGVEVVKNTETFPPNETLKESQMDHVKDETGKEQTLEMENIKEVETLMSTETIEAPKEFRDDDISDEKNVEQSLETEPAKEVEAMAPSETFPQVDTVKESEADPKEDVQDEEQTLEMADVQEVGSLTIPVAERNVSTSDSIDNSSDAESTEGVAKGRTSSVENSEMDSVTNGNDKDQTLQMYAIEEVEEMATSKTIEAPEEIQVDHITNQKNDKDSLDTEVSKAEEVMAPSETFSNIETLQESREDPNKDEQHKEQALEMANIEEESLENSVSASDVVENFIDAECSEGLSKGCTSSVDNGDISTNDNDICTVSEIVDNTEDEVESMEEIKSECTTTDLQNTFETNDEENIRAELHDPNHGSIASDESQSTSYPAGEDNTLFLSSADGLKSLSSSEQPSELLSEPAVMDSSNDNTPIEVSERGPDEAIETVKDYEEPEAETEKLSFFTSQENSELMPDRTEKLDGDQREPEGVVESDSSSQDKIIDVSDAEKIPLEAAVQSEHTDDGGIQTLQCEDETDESNASVSCATDETNTIEMSDIPDSSTEDTEIGSSIEQDQSTEESANAEDPQYTSSETGQQSDTLASSLTEQLNESSKARSEDYSSSQVMFQDSDEDDRLDEEGQSFDFDDLDLDEAIGTSLPKEPKWEEIEEGVEVALEENNKASLELSQSNTESNENTQDKPEESNDDKCTADGGHQVDTLRQESETESQSNQNSLAHEDANSDKGKNVVKSQMDILEEVGVTEEPRHITEEGKVLDVGEQGFVSENVNQAMSLPLEEGLDAVKHELKDEDSASLKSYEVLSSNQEPQQTGKNVRKNSKKGKGKGKEDCKMS